jgi:thioredoxin reductase (NADPH)
MFTQSPSCRAARVCASPADSNSKEKCLRGRKFLRVSFAFREECALVIRAQSLSSTMSDYLIQRIEASPQITVHVSTEVTAVSGDTWLRRIELTERTRGTVLTKDVANLFLMIGADPNTSWLRDCLPLDAKGFVETGVADASSPFATALPGIFAVGDVRSGSVKRVASAVGEGSILIQAVHRFLHPNSS